MMSNNADQTSLSLLHRATADDNEAWTQLVHLYGPLVQKWCQRAGLADEDTADVFQETFRTVSTNLPGFSPRKSVGSFRSWLRSIVRTRIIDHHRTKSRQTPGLGGTAAQLRLANITDPIGDDASDDANDHAVLVQRAMEIVAPEFTARNWAAFQQIAIKGRSATEVAEELGVDAQAVRQANYRIRRRLRLILQDLLD